MEGLLNRKRMFTLTSYNICIPTPELKIEMTFFDSQYDSMAKIVNEVGGSERGDSTFSIKSAE